MVSVQFGRLIFLIYDKLIYPWAFCYSYYENVTSIVNSFCLFTNSSLTTEDCSEYKGGADEAGVAGIDVL